MDNFIFKITLMGVKNPRITRTLSCPAGTNFHDFHKAIIIAFGWALTHIYMFNVLPQPGAGFFAPQAIHEFSDEQPEDTFVSWSDSRGTELGEYMAQSVYRGKYLQYLYDFGDHWDHSITYIGRAPKTAKVLCIDGEGHGPAEDVGGVEGWEELKKAYKASNPDKRQKELREWYQDQCTNGYQTGLGGERVWRWDQDRINRDLLQLPEMEWKHDRNRDS